MKYYTRQYKSLEYLNSGLLEPFIVEERASAYSQEYYELLCKERFEELSEIYKEMTESELHTMKENGLAIYLLAHLPYEITMSIADIRVFLLYRISALVYDKINELCEENLILKKNT